MDPLRYLTETEGFFLRRDANRLGIDDRTLTRGVRRGDWVRIRQGAYCHRDIWQSLSEIDQHLRRARASYDLTPGLVAMSHLSAVAEHGCPVWHAPLETVHLTRTDEGSSRREAGVVHHVGTVDTSQLVEVNGRKVTDPTRTTVDAASLVSVESGLVIANWMIHQGLTSPEKLWEAKQQCNQTPGTRHLEVTLRLCDGRNESVAESRAHHLFWRVGLPKPELQYPIHDASGELIAITDFGWPDAGVYAEFDGKVKYGRLLAPGQEPGDAVFAEKRREDLIRAATGGTVVRLVWDELHPRSRPVLQLLHLLRRPA